MQERDNGLAGRQFRVFAVMWAVATLFDIWNQLPWPVPPATGAVALGQALLGLMVIARPSSPGWLVLLAVARCGEGLLLLPGVPNHRFLAIFAELAIITSFVAARGVDRRRVEPGRMFEQFAPCVRMMFAISYAASALAKYNTSFLDPTQSCAAELYRSIQRQWMHGIPDWGVYPAVWSTIGVETLVAICLFVPRLRSCGVVAGSLFHFLLSATPVVAVMDFSTMLFALFYLFAPPSLTERLTARRDAADAAGEPRGIPAAAWIVGGLLALVTLLMLFHPADHRSEGPQLMLRFLLYFGYGAGWCLLVLPLWWEGREPGRTFGALRPLRHPVHGVLVLLTLISAACPYVGLKTRTSFTMFSNLRTEAHRSNHLFLPQLYVADYQNDLVEIRESVHEDLQKYADDGLLLTWFEFVRFAKAHPDVPVRYLRDGEEQSFERVGDVVLAEAPPWWISKTLIFRPVEPDDTCRCQW